MFSFILILVILIKSDTLTSYKCCKIKMHISNKIRRQNITHCTQTWGNKFLRSGVEGMRYWSYVGKLWRWEQDRVEMSDAIFQVFRNILASEPRVTRFKINWDDTDTMHQSTEDTAYKMEEKVSSDGAVGFSENSSQSVMEVMWMCYKRTGVFSFASVIAWLSLQMTALWWIL